MKLVRRKVDLQRLAEYLKERGFIIGAERIVLGEILEAGNRDPKSIEPLGYFRSEDPDWKKVGFRHVQHRLDENIKNPHLPVPKVGDRVFFVPFQPPPDKETGRQKRPYALKWGRLEDLPKSCLETESFFTYLLEGIKRWRKYPKIS